MATIYFISDLHLGHKNILNFCSAYREGFSVEEHNEWIISQWNSVVSKRDTVYVLGDIVFGVDNLKLLERLKGHKHLVLGNHDTYPTKSYLEHFNKVHGLLKYKEFWLSHAPIHPIELRGKVNLHGHVHQHSIIDKRYFNVCVDNLYGVPISIDQVRKRLKEK